MKTSAAFVIALPAVVCLSFSLIGRSTGTLPGFTFGIPIDAARTGPSCGGCHGQTPAAAPLVIDLTPSARSLIRGQSIQVSLTARGGVQSPSTMGGFAAETSAGTFSAGATTQTDPTGRFASHTAPYQRDWKFGYTAPFAPGLVEFWAVVNTVNGGIGGDTWGFHGVDPAATSCTPVRLYVNAPGVRSVGDGCEGSYGSHPILGSDQDPVLGNRNFAIELVGAHEATTVSLLVGLVEPRPIDLGPIGLVGCTLFVYPLDTMQAKTSTGTALRSEGNAVFGLPMPVETVLAGARIYVQAVIVDPANARTIPLTLTNVLEISIR